MTQWELLAGDEPHALHPVASRRRTGFETRLAIGDGSARYVAVRARAGARVLGSSLSKRMN